jgi:hypothetical protein
MIVNVVLAESFGVIAVTANCNMESNVSTGTEIKRPKKGTWGGWERHMSQTGQFHVALCTWYR